VIVEITDRGPWVKNRVIDLSKRAAEEIDLIGPGTGPVEIILLKPR
jgi:rare lipoprotein A